MEIARWRGHCHIFFICASVGVVVWLVKVTIEAMLNARQRGGPMVTNGEDEAKSAWQQVLLPVQGIGSMDRGMQFAGALLSRPFDAVSTFKSTAPGRGTSSYSEGEDWKTLESEWAKYYRKWKSTEEVGSFVAAIMKLEKEWIWHWRPEERKHAVGRSIELAGILSEKDDRKQAGIAEPIVSLQQAIAESRESVKQYYMATRGDTEDQANKRVDAFLKRQDKLIANWQAEGMSDHHIAEFL